MPIIRRNNSICAALGICYSVWMTDCIPDSHPYGIKGNVCILDSHPYRITSTKCSINAIVSPDDGHIIVRNT